MVEKSLAGESSQIKAYTVATQVFGRSDDFDQAYDPIVSIQANKLRRALERYYLVAGKHDPLRIDSPKGNYVPTFSEQLTSSQYIASEKAATISVMESWPTIMLPTLKSLTDNPDDDYLSVDLTTELAHALSRYQNIRVLVAPHRNQELASPETHVDFIIEGNVRRDPVGVKVAVRLVDAKPDFPSRGRILIGKYIKFEDIVDRMIEGLNKAGLKLE